MSKRYKTHVVPIVNAPVALLPVLGTFLLICGVTTVQDITRKLLGTFHFGMFVILGCGIAVSALGAYLIFLGWRMRSLRPMERLSATFTTDSATLARVAAERDIRPRFELDGTGYFDPIDFSDASTLLRASQTPNTASTLLQPVRYNASRADELLQAADRPE